MSRRTHVKVCGITRVSDALLSSKLEAYAIGINFWPQSRRCVSLSHARDICRVVPGEMSIAAVFVDPAPDLVHETINALPLALLQFHGKESPDFCKQFGIPYVKAVRVAPDTDLLQYAAQYSDARALLLDAHVAGQPGGTGHAFDWQLIPSKMPIPIILSGGLNPSNVKTAIKTVRPWAVDVASGVESAPGIKDAAKLAAFMQEVRDADLRSA
jgi:phosphoribosylanthranilate isomerase